MRALIDTNILLDVALNRTAFVRESAAVLRWAEIEGNAGVAWHSLSNCSYLLKSAGRPFLSKLLKIVDVPSVGAFDAIRALSLPMSDLEDAFQAAAALAFRADYIVTRDTAGFSKSPVPGITPVNFLKKIASTPH
jgi:predicted nucleic acid-binding protein